MKIFVWQPCSKKRNKKEAGKMAKYRWLTKKNTLLWYSFCAAILLSSIFSHLLISQNEFSNLSHPTSSLVSITAESPVSYLDLLNAGITRGQNPFFLSQKDSSQRIPLRLPIPSGWVSFLFVITGWMFPSLCGTLSGEKKENLDGFIIRYIHNQNGETYHLSLF
jgi:hypothetical protein